MEQRQAFNRLGEVLKEQGWTQQQLADELTSRLQKDKPIKVQSIQQYCSNRTQMSVQRLFLVADILGVDARMLLASDTPLQLVKGFESMQVGDSTSVKLISRKDNILCFEVTSNPDPVDGGDPVDTNGGGE